MPNSAGVLIVAIPLNETRQTLTRLLTIEAVVSLVVLAALAAAAWFLIKRDLRPLETMAVTADAIAAGDLAQARAAGRAADGGRPARPQPEHDAQPHRGGVRGARRHRGEAAALPRRRLARAAHAAHQHPRLLRGVRARQGRPREPRAGHAPHRGGEQAHGRDGRGAAGARAPRRRARAARSSPVDLARVVDDA